LPQLFASQEWHFIEMSEPSPSLISDDIIPQRFDLIVATMKFLIQDTHNATETDTQRLSQLQTMSTMTWSATKNCWKTNMQQKGSTNKVRAVPNMHYNVHSTFTCAIHLDNNLTAREASKIMHPIIMESDWTIIFTNSSSF